ncbi:hypothetical protein [Methylobacterium flocculans]|jgi:hypothetical protein|uniref:hypothetical protein n=1 Tax=Methylobacterium flocculans TaxID=2984843 RepID=UPI0021F39903|nr:hypothetical protein [Methylobacterium sp. FF17]
MRDCNVRPPADPEALGGPAMHGIAQGFAELYDDFGTAQIPERWERLVDAIAGRLGEARADERD